MDANRQERIENISEKIIVKNLERGILYEPYARQAYEQEKGISVQQVGFVELDDSTGCSPDGLVSFNGILEIKCPDSHNFVLDKGTIKGAV